MAQKKQRHKRPPQRAAATEAPRKGAPGLTVARGLLIICAGIAAYLAWASFASGPIAGCGPESGCSKVLQSRWAYWLGLPVSVPSLGVYLGLLFATFKLRDAGGRAPSLRLSGVTTALALTVIAAAIWFVFLQAVVIGSFCRFCMAAHISGIVAALLIIGAVRKQTPRGMPGAAGRVWGRAASLSALALVVLVGGQTLVSKTRHRVQTAASQPASSAPAPAPAPPESPQPRSLSIHNGQFKLLLDELPMIGDPSAPRVMVSLFDYTCHYCRDLHGLLVQAQRKYSNQLAIINLPMPLDANCNRLMTRTPGAHQNACEYAKLGLAVWRAQRERSAEFDDWVFAPGTPLPVDQVRRHAEELVGKENLERALADPWINQQIQTSISIYEANFREMRSGSMPQLIVGDAISVGPLDSFQQLEMLLRQHLAL